MEALWKQTGRFESVADKNERRRASAVYRQASRCGPAPLLDHALLRPGVRRARCDRWVPVTKDFREDMPEIFSFGSVIARGFRRRPVIEHRPDRLFLERRVQLQELVKSQQPGRLRSVFVSPVPHQRDVLSQNLSQHAAERPGPAQFGKGLFRITQRQSALDRHALLDIACFAQGGDGIAVDRLGI